MSLLSIEYFLGEREGRSGGETEKSSDASLLALSPLGDQPGAAKLILKPYQRKVVELKG